MLFKTKSELGMICIKDTAIKTIASHVACSCYGVVGLAHRKTKQSFFNFNDDKISDSIKVSYNNGLIIDLHIYVSYGMNINAIAQSIVHKVQYTVSETTGIKVDKVTVKVDGIKD